MGVHESGSQTKGDETGDQPQPLRLLIVDDSEDDCLLFIQQLRRSGFNPVFLYISTLT